MSKTAEALTKVLQSTVEQLLLDGESPREIVVNLLAYSQWFSEKSLPLLARAQIDMNDSLAEKSTQWTKDGDEWGIALRSEDADFDLYERLERNHQESIAQDQSEADGISAQAGFLSTAAFQAGAMLNCVKELDLAPTVPTEEIVDQLVARSLAVAEGDEDAVEQSSRFKTVLRSLVGFGTFGHHPRSPHSFDDE